jgi:hypothetical protein
MQPFSVACVVAGIALVAGCTAAGTGTRTGSPSAGRAPVSIMGRPCLFWTPILAVSRQAAVDRHYSDLEAKVEQPLRKLVVDDTLAEEALRSLDHAVLERRDWTLTRFLVRLLRELEVKTLADAMTTMSNARLFAQRLGDAGWDGYGGLDVVTPVKAEVREILRALDEAPGSSKLTEQLFAAARKPEPYAAYSTCRMPSDR